MAKNPGESHGRGPDLNNANLMPNLFIVGAGKAGTSALAEYLGAHNDIYMAPRKELNFFGNDLDYRASRINLEEYLALFRDGKGALYRGDASVQYLLSKEAASEIKKASPDARILIMLRNPVDVMYARHAQNVFAGDEVLLDFVSAINAEPRRRKGIEVPKAVSCVEWIYYNEWVKFTEQVERYFNIFGRDRVWVGLYDDLKADPLALYKDVTHFLGIDSSFQPNFRLVNMNRKPRLHVVQRALTGRYNFVKVASRWLFPSSRIRDLIVTRLMALNSKTEEREALSADIRLKLLTSLTPEIMSLSRLIGRDLSSWLV